MNLAFAETSASTVASVAPMFRVPAVGKWTRMMAVAFALALGGAVLMSATASASPVCSGSVLVAEAVELPDLSRIT